MRRVECFFAKASKGSGRGSGIIGDGWNRIHGKAKVKRDVDRLDRVKLTIKVSMGSEYWIHFLAVMGY